MTMKTPVSGSRIKYFFQRVATSASAPAELPLTTENGRTISVSADSTQTKDGVVRSTAAAELEITGTALLAAEDTLIDDLETAAKNGETVKIWEVYADKKGTGNKYKANFYKAVISSLEISSPADGNVEVSITFGIIGTGASGEATATITDGASAAYAFEDMTAGS